MVSATAIYFDKVWHQCQLRRTLKNAKCKIGPKERSDNSQTKVYTQPICIYRIRRTKKSTEPGILKRSSWLDLKILEENQKWKPETEKTQTRTEERKHEGKAINEKRQMTSNKKKRVEDDELCQVSTVCMLLDSTIKHIAALMKRSLRQ